MAFLKKYDTILFDADDTLFDFNTSGQEAFQQSFTTYGLPNALTDYRENYNEISSGLWNDLEQGRITISELAIERFKRLFEKEKLDIPAQVFSDLYLTNLGEQAHLVQGAVELCDRLADFQLAIITNGYTKVQESRIKNSPLASTFEQVIISEQVGSPKPGKEIFDVAFSKLNITNKTKVLMVGDSLTSDIQGGNNYGIDTCWFNPHRQENTLPIQPTYEIHQLIDLVDLVTYRQNI